jgi:hypothetical protein
MQIIPRNYNTFTTARQTLFKSRLGLQLALPTHIRLHFLYAMLSCQRCDQSFTSFSLSCKLPQSSLALNTVYNFKSSAYSLQVHLLSLNNWVMSLINNTNKSGPITLPCTTPLLSLVEADSELHTRVCCDLSLRKLVIHLINVKNKRLTHEL